VKLERLLYIGQAKNLRARMVGHKWPVWARYVAAGRTLWINATPVAESIRDLEFAP
jgi:hypothetical protein